MSSTFFLRDGLLSGSCFTGCVVVDVFNLDCVDKVLLGYILVVCGLLVEVSVLDDSVEFEVVSAGVGIELGVLLLKKIIKIMFFLVKAHFYLNFLINTKNLCIDI